MSSIVFSLATPILIGLGATLTFDLWVLFLKHAFKVPPSNMCVVGRWLRYMPEGIFRHASIVSAPRKSAECTVGWIAHYTIGVLFAITFTAITGGGWFRHPTLIPALSFGLVTAFAPFFIMQPLFGLGFAASKTLNPSQARFRTLTNHAVFGAGLYVFGWLMNWLL